MAEKDFGETLTIITAAVTMSMEAMNLKIPMNQIQILDLSEAIIDTAGEDNLSIEDLMLFLQYLIRGKYHPLYESMDVPKFMEKFEIYRQERHEAVLGMRENNHLYYRSIGDTNRNTETVGNALDRHLSEFTNKLSAMKDELKEKQSEIKRLRQSK